MPSSVQSAEEDARSCMAGQDTSRHKTPAVCLPSSKSLSLMSAGERAWIEACMVRAIALYLAQHAGRRYATLFSDEADGSLDPERKRMFMAMKREVLRLGGYEQEYFITQTPELAAMADAVIDLDAMMVVSLSAKVENLSA